MPPSPAVPEKIGKGKKVKKSGWTTHGSMIPTSNILSTSP